MCLWSRWRFVVKTDLIYWKIRYYGNVMKTRETPKLTLITIKNQKPLAIVERHCRSCSAKQQSSVAAADLSARSWARVGEHHLSNTLLLRNFETYQILHILVSGPFSACDGKANMKRIRSRIQYAVSSIQYAEIYPHVLARNSSTRGMHPPFT